MLLSSFPGGDRQSSTGEEKPRVTADATRASGRGGAWALLLLQPPTDLDGVAGLDPAEQGTRAVTLQLHQMPLVDRSKARAMKGGGKTFAHLQRGTILLLHVMRTLRRAARPEPRREHRQHR